MTGGYQYRRSTQPRATKNPGIFPLSLVCGSSSPPWASARRSCAPLWCAAAPPLIHVLYYRPMRLWASFTHLVSARFHLVFARFLCVPLDLFYWSELEVSALSSLGSFASATSELSCCCSLLIRPFCCSFIPLARVS